MISKKVMIIIKFNSNTSKSNIDTLHHSYSLAIVQGTSQWPPAGLLA